MRISDWSSDVCSSDLRQGPPKGWQRQLQKWGRCTVIADLEAAPPSVIDPPPSPSPVFLVACVAAKLDRPAPARDLYASPWFQKARAYVERQGGAWFILRSEEHPSELQSLMRLSYAVSCLQKKNKNNYTITKK